MIDMKQKIVMFSVFAVLVLSACKTTHTIVKSEQPAKPTPNQVVQVIEKVKKTQPQFKTANISKMSLALDLKERKLNVSATCKIKMDSAIFISIQPFLGIEMFKAELTTDSMRVFDKMNHRYYVVDYGFFNKHFGVNVDFYSLQSLFTAQFFCIGNKEIQVDSCKLVTSTAGQNEIDYANDNIAQSTEISPLSLIQQVILKDKNSDYQLQMSYKDFAMQNAVNFPQTISLQASNQNTKASCDFSILRVEFNGNVRFSATNPDRFTKGDIEQLLKK